MDPMPLLPVPFPCVTFLSRYSLSSALLSLCLFSCPFFLPMSPCRFSFVLPSCPMRFLPLPCPSVHPFPRSSLPFPCLNLLSFTLFPRAFLLSSDPFLCPFLLSPFPFSCPPFLTSSSALPSCLLSLVLYPTALFPTLCPTLQSLVPYPVPYPHIPFPLS